MTAQISSRLPVDASSRHHAVVSVMQRSATEEKLVRLRAAIERITLHALEGETHAAGLRQQLQAAIGKLRVDVLEEFEKETLPHLRRLDLVLEKGLGLPVPALSVCGFGTAEVRYTQLFAFYLDARNHHGLGGRLARSIFEGRVEGGSELPWDTCTAQAEYPLGKSELSDRTEMWNSLDLLLEVGGRRILVEQKINSAEGDEQLHRYSAAARSLFGDTVDMFFLTPDGRGGRNEEWKEISHDELIRSMATMLDRPDPELSSTARHNLRALLLDLVMGPLAQDPKWIDELRDRVHQVVNDSNRAADIKRWFQREGMSYDALKVVARLAE